MLNCILCSNLYSKLKYKSACMFPCNQPFHIKPLWVTLFTETTKFVVSVQKFWSSVESVVDVPIFGIIKGFVSNAHDIVIVNHLFRFIRDIFRYSEESFTKARTMPSHCNCNCTAPSQLMVNVWVDVIPVLSKVHCQKYSFFQIETVSEPHELLWGSFMKA